MIEKAKTIFYAEDDSDDQEIFIQAIAEISSDIHVEIFPHCSGLLNDLAKQDHNIPDLIFLDFNIPGNYNFECLKAIKQSPRTCKIPVIIYSTANNIYHIEKAAEHGAVQYLVKENVYLEIKESLRKVISTFDTTDILES